MSYSKALELITGIAIFIHIIHLIQIANSAVTNSWVPLLPVSLERERLNIVEVERSVFKGLTAQLCTNTYLLALREIVHGITITSANTEGRREFLTSQCEHVLNQLLSRYNAGLVYNWGPVSILAQLPSTEYLEDHAGTI